MYRNIIPKPSCSVVKRTRIKLAYKPEVYYIFPKRRNWLQKLIIRWITGCEVEDYNLEIVVGDKHERT